MITNRQLLVLAIAWIAVLLLIYLVLAIIVNRLGLPGIDVPWWLAM